MSILVALMGFGVAALLATGLYLLWRPGLARAVPPSWFKAGLLANWLVLGLAMAGVLLLGVDQVMAQSVAQSVAEGVAQGAAVSREISVGQGLALLGIGLPTGLAAIAAAIALGPVGSAALAVIAEKPELFGRTLVYMGLAEGIAIYGLVMSILMLGKL